MVPVELKPTYIMSFLIKDFTVSLIDEKMD